MYSTLVYIHSNLRWLILVAATVAVLYALYGTLARATWQRAGDIVGSIFTWSLRVNLLLGFVLWGMKWGQEGFNFFYHFLHPAIMFSALALAEIMAARRRRQSEDPARWRAFLIGTVLPTALVLFGIPRG